MGGGKIIDFPSDLNAPRLILNAGLKSDDAGVVNNNTALASIGAPSNDHMHTCTPGCIYLWGEGDTTSADERASGDDEITEQGRVIIL